MTEAVHGSFTLERVFAASPARVFRVWADPAIKARWFVGIDGWQPLERSIDFRVAGKERMSGRTGSVSEVGSSAQAVALDQTADDLLSSLYVQRKLAVV